jgi:3-hydroxyacyl-CoA dehydrogenase
METLSKTLNDSRYNYPDLLDKMIEDGHLGRKTRKGFYDYKDK